MLFGFFDHPNLGVDATTSYSKGFLRHQTTGSLRTVYDVNCHFFGWYFLEGFVYALARKCYYWRNHV